MARSRRRQGRADQVDRLKRGLCPIHGAGLCPDEVPARGGFLTESCPRTGCGVVVQVSFDDTHYIVLSPRPLRGMSTTETALELLARAADESV